MKTYTVIGGVNGVGKSSLTGVLKSLLYDMGMMIDCETREDADVTAESCLEKQLSKPRKRIIISACFTLPCPLRRKA